MCRSYCNIDEVANSRSPHTLELSRQQMQALGYSVVDTLIEHFETLRQKPPTRKGERPDLEGRLREAPPEPPAEPARLIEQLQRDVFSNMMHVDHPRFFAFVPSPGNFVGAMADALASGFNPFVGTWLAGSGPAQLELVTIDWLREICGMPESAGGLFLSGGSMANLTALAVARHGAARRKRGARARLLLGPDALVRGPRLARAGLWLRSDPQIAQRRILSAIHAGAGPRRRCRSRRR